MNPKYPVYVVSKGRWKSRKTSKALEKMNVPYYIVIEEQEYEQYAAVIDEKKILILDKKYQDEYDTFDDLGDTKSKGPGAARNFVWQHSIDLGAKRHWVIDDNMDYFFRLNRNTKIPVASGTIFQCAEDFTDRYENVAISGFDYDKFCCCRDKESPYLLNTRIYSCLLIKNDIPYRWRGRYNEDTDICLRVLKDGLCTILFKAFLCGKLTTQVVKGGNTGVFYDKEGTLPKSEMLQEMHPDVTEVVFKFNRWHHKVNYKQFRNNILIKRKDYKEVLGVNNYGMVLAKEDRAG